MTPDLRIRPPDFKRTKPLSEIETIAMTGAFRDAIQRETSSPAEACHVALAIVATFCMDMCKDDVEVMAKDLQKLKNKIVSDFRTGRLRMTRRAQA